MKPQILDDAPCVPEPARHWLRPTRTRVLVVLAIAFSVWGWFDVRLRGTVDPNIPIHKTDFTVYTEAGAAFFDGRDPYKVTNPRGWGYLYPPLFAILVAPLHALEPRTQVLVWFAISLVLGWGCYVECVRIARVVMPRPSAAGIFGPIPTWIGAAAVTAAALPAFNCLQRGQVGIAKLYLMLLGFRLLVENRSAARSFLAGIVLALPIVLKLTPLLPVALVLFQELVAAWHGREESARWPRAAACSTGTLCGLALFLFVVPASLVGWNANLRHLNSWVHWVASPHDGTTGDEFAGDSTSLRNQSFTNAAHRFGNWASYALAGGPHDEGPEQLRKGGGGLAMDAPAARVLLLAVRFVAGCLLVIVGYRLGRAQDALGRTVGFGLACIATLVIAPVAWGHYYVLYLPAAAFLSAWLVRAGRPRAAQFFALTPAALVIAHYALLDYAGRIGLLGLGTLLWYTSAAIVLVAHRETSAARGELPGAGPPHILRRWAKSPAAADRAAYKSSTVLSRWSLRVDWPRISLIMKLIARAY